MLSKIDFIYQITSINQIKSTFGPVGPFGPSFVFKAGFALGALAHSFLGSFAGRSIEASWTGFHSFSIIYNII